MPFVIRYMGHQDQIEADTRAGRRVFPRGTAVAMRGGEGHQLLGQANLQFERVMPADEAYAGAVDPATLAAPTPAEPETPAP